MSLGCTAVQIIDKIEYIALSLFQHMAGFVKKLDK